MLKRIICIAVCYFLLLPLANAANEVSAIRIVEHADKTRIVFDLKRKPVFNIFSRSRNSEIVVDFAATKSRVNFAKLARASSSLKRVEKGKATKANDLRVIFHLSKKHKFSYFELAATKKLHHRLVVDLPKSSSGGQKTVAKKQVVKKTNPKPKPKPAVTGRDVIVAIDAGHGGKDPGSIGFKRFVEKDITLSVSKRVAAILNQKKGIKAVLIRDKDVFISLNERSNLARKHKAELLVSIHADGFTSSKPRGASTLVLSNGRANREFGKKLNSNNLDNLLGGVGEAIRSSEKTDDLQRTFLELGMQNSRYEGHEVASLIHKELSRVTYMHKSEPIQQSLAVLKSLDIPSLLVEVGFVTNYAEGKKLTTAKHQHRVANAIAQGIYKHFRTAPPKDTYLAQQLRKSHTVAKGESLSVIASKYGTTINSLKQANNLTKNTVYIGQKLKIPTS